MLQQLLEQPYIPPVNGIAHGSVKGVGDLHQPCSNHLRFDHLFVLPFAICWCASSKQGSPTTNAAATTGKSEVTTQAAGKTGLADFCIADGL